MEGSILEPAAIAIEIIYPKNQLILLLIHLNLQLAHVHDFYKELILFAFASISALVMLRIRSDSLSFQR